MAGVNSWTVPAIPGRLATPNHRPKDVPLSGDVFVYELPFWAYCMLNIAKIYPDLLCYIVSHYGYRPAVKALRSQ